MTKHDRKAARKLAQRPFNFAAVTRAESFSRLTDAAIARAFGWRNAFRIYMAEAAISDAAARASGFRLPG